MGFLLHGYKINVKDSIFYCILSVSKSVTYIIMQFTSTQKMQQRNCISFIFFYQVMMAVLSHLMPVNLQQPLLQWSYSILIMDVSFSCTKTYLASFMQFLNVYFKSKAWASINRLSLINRLQSYMHSNLKVLNNLGR